MYFRDLIGHGAIVDNLQSSLRDDRMPHALLFAGPRGVGKRSTADALLAARFCEGEERGQRIDGCGSCRGCRAFAHGNHPDFERVEREAGKRDIGIPQVRALMDFLHRRPHWASSRAAIIDEAHRMTMEAQNAFLKTLEEPPPGATLILVTPLAERLLPTVHSRCASLRFSPLEESEMATFVASQPDATGVPTALASGSPGMWLRLSRADVTSARAAVIGFLCDPAQGSPFAFAADLLKHASAGASEEDEDDDGREQTRDRLLIFLRLLAFAVRDLQVLAYGLDGVRLYHEDQRQALWRAAARLDPDRLFDAGEACDQAVTDLFRNVDPALLLEAVAAAVRGHCRVAV